MPRKTPRVTAEHLQEANSFRTMDGREWSTNEVEVHVTCDADKISQAIEDLRRAVADVERQLAQLDKRVIVAGLDGAQDG